jgi:AcrR family transcriptional regulator
MKRRAAAQEATRLRITESAVELHETLGPARTSMAAVAERAGVERSTLYRHFPDEAALFAACSAHWNGQHVRPNLERWLEIRDPNERLVEGLAELYAWYRSTGLMLDRLIRDEPLVPAVAERFGAFHRYHDRAREVLLAGRGLRGRRRATAEALLRVALAFETWRALCREGGLDDRDAAGRMAELVAGADRPEPAR